MLSTIRIILYMQLPLPSLHVVDSAIRMVVIIMLYVISCIGLHMYAHDACNTFY